MASSSKIDDLRKRFEENPRRYFAPLANEYRKAGDIEQAIAICREFLPQQPGHMSGHIVFGQALYEARQLDEAKTVFETALSLDPENLIALKHLGDITLMAGDSEAAKGWYKRVLDADPRNEETLAQLATIEAAGKPGAGTPTPVASLSTQSTQPIPVAKATAASSAPTVVMNAMKAPVRLESKPTAAAPTAESATQEIRLEGLTASQPPATKADAGIADIPATLVMEVPVVKPPAPADVPPLAVGLETTAMAGTEAPPLDSFSLEGLETTSMAPAAPPPPPPPPQPVTASIDLDFGPAGGSPAPAAPSLPPAPAQEVETLVIDLPPAPPAATAPTPAAEPAMVDLDFAPDAAAPAPAEAPATPAAPAAIELDLPSAAPEATPVEVPDIAIDIAGPVAEPAAAATPPVDTIDLGLAPPAPASQSGPFVTETMAELYLQQGHRDEALRVYRALLADRPGDAGLAAKVAGLEAPATPEPRAPVDGPSIRSILLLVAQRRPGFRPEGAANGSSPTTHEAAPAAESTAPARIAPEVLAPDALGALWGNAAPSAHEEDAAIMLAIAFHDLNGMVAGAVAAPAVAGGGAPTPAPGGPPPAPPSSFSYDKFFSQRVTAEHATTPGAPASPAESREDVAQFTRWLEGLKQQ